MPEAELIFVAGPEEGQRSALLSDHATFGRSPSCDVQATEQTVSRHQASFARLPEGWTVENVGHSPLRINGKRYKPGRKVLLETGDVLEVGERTEVLYVAPGDDPEPALRAWRAEHPPAERAAPPPPAAPAPGPSPSAEQAKGRTAAGKAVEAPSEASPEKRKRRRYVLFAVAFVVYAVGIFLVIGALAGRGDEGGTETGGGNGELRRLTRGEVERSLRGPIEAPKYASEADKALQKALQYYRTALDRPGDLYRSVKHFKLYLAYKGDKVFGDPHHERTFMKAQEELVEKVWGAYADAWVYEQRKDWRKALQGYERVQRMLPVTEEPHADRDNLVFQNVLRHVSYVRRNLGRRR